MGNSFYCIVVVVGRHRRKDRARARLVDVAVETDRRPRAGDRSHALARALTAHIYGGRRRRPRYAGAGAATAPCIL